MATKSHTWAFAANLENLAALGDDAQFNLQWAATDGNPAGSAEWFQTAGAGTANGERARDTTAPTWESLFGIPSGSTVTGVQCTSFDELCWNFANITSRRVRIRLVNGSGVSVHSAGELQDLSGGIGAANNQVVNATGTASTKAAGTAQPVDAGSQPSNSVVKLEIQVSIVTTATPTLDLEQDTIVIVATYLPPGSLWLPRRMPLGV